MLLTLTTSHQPASDLGFLLHKHPDRFQSFGQVHVFYSEVDEDSCTFRLLLDVNPVEFVRRKSRGCSLVDPEASCMGETSSVD